MESLSTTEWERGEKKGLSQDWLWERGKKASPTAELRFMR